MLLEGILKVLLIQNVAERVLEKKFLHLLEQKVIIIKSPTFIYHIFLQC